jgi:hypothetical protein
MTVMIGVDPHKRSHTAVAIDGDDGELAAIEVRASVGQVDELLGWAERFDARIWAVEGAKQHSPKPARTPTRGRRGGHRSTTTRDATVDDRGLGRLSQTETSQQPCPSDRVNSNRPHTQDKGRR